MLARGAHAMPLTLKKIDDELRRLGHDVHLEKGDGYFYEYSPSGRVGCHQSRRWHDWWNASSRDARVQVEITPGLRFVHMIETFFGLARLTETAERRRKIYTKDLTLTGLLMDADKMASHLTK